MTLEDNFQYSNPESLLMEGKYAHELPIPSENPLKKRVAQSWGRTLEALGEPH